ncbi:AraC family transcriptional regulator [Mycobacteroides chelonae]|nr:AraC family transcriptional regulator [Mycobacteroides chelonae]OHT69858.1 AraC family transcriptional regulator [Mycobacteroides chelonae]OHT84724.1 AraC family transcriptional regulator [Mycobacteroides chelonae]
MDLLVVPGAGPVGVATTLDVVEGLARSHNSPAAALVDVRVVGGEAGTVPLRGGMSVSAVPISMAGAPRPWVVIPGIGHSAPSEIDQRLAQEDLRAAVNWLAGASDSRVAASCTGTFVAAEAGFLDGRAATTTWWLAGLFAARYPHCRIDADQMIVRDGPVLTAGAVMGHLDLLFAIVDEVFGAEVARSVAARAAAAPRSSQGQFRRSALYREIDPDLVAIERLVLARMDRPIRLAELAEEAHLSTRTLARRVRVATGMSPVQFAQRIKVEAALDLLRDPRRSIADVAAAVGVADASTLNRLIRRTTGRSPGSFRVS